MYNSNNKNASSPNRLRYCRVTASAVYTNFEYMTQIGLSHKTK